MKKIPLTRGYVALVDDADYPLVAGYKWVATTSQRKNIYAQAAVRGASRRWVKMHRLILQLRPGELGDHINGDGLDNRRQNLRKCTPTQNAQNRRIRNKTRTGHQGVWPNGSGFAALITHQGKRHYLGQFRTCEAAAAAYGAKAHELRGEFAARNVSEKR